MIIKSLSTENNLLAKKSRDLLEATGIEVVHLIPFGVQRLNITEDIETNLYTVYLTDRNNILDSADAFMCFEYALNYAKVIVKEAGLSEDDIQVKF